MTAIRKTLGDRVVAPFYDQELENLIEGEARCAARGCYNVATWSVKTEGLCSCRYQLCDACLARARRKLAGWLTTDPPARPCLCVRCQARGALRNLKIPAHPI